MSAGEITPGGSGAPLLRPPRGFVSALRPAPLLFGGIAFSLSLGLAAFLGLRGEGVHDGSGPSSHSGGEPGRPAVLETLPKSYAEAYRFDADITAQPGKEDPHMSDVIPALHEPPAPLPASVNLSMIPPRPMFFNAPESTGATVGRMQSPFSSPVGAHAVGFQSAGTKEARKEAETTSGSLPLPAPTLRAGDFINAALLTAIDSDLPGTVVAQVTRNVFDHASGRVLLIPQGARLIGRYESKPGYGSRRATVAWREVVFPDGRSLSLDNMLATDTSGATGLEDQTDTHISPIMRAIAMSTALTVGGAAAQSANAKSTGSTVLNDAASGASTRASEVGQRFVDRDLNQAPTLKIRPGWPVAVIVEHDLAAPAFAHLPSEALRRP